MSTVYILGAGASRHVGYPLISDMGKESLEWMAAYPNGYFLAASDFLVERFGRTPNIEDVITDLESSIRALAKSPVAEDKSRRMRLGTVRGQYLTALREWFRQIHLRPAPAYAKLADAVIQAGDTVLTFNYDDSLERELQRAGKWDVSRGYGFELGPGRSSPVLVLKPHGSINWFASLFDGRTSGMAQIDPDDALGHQPVIHKADVEFLGCTDFSGRLYKGGGALVSLILPNRYKEPFYWKPFFDYLWAQTERALKRADKLVVCGYGMSPADKRACDAILNMPSRETAVEIVCGSQGQRIAADFRSAGCSNVSFDTMGRFEQWVDVYSPAKNPFSRIARSNPTEDARGTSALPVEVSGALQNEKSGRVTLNLYRVKEVRDDYVVLADSATEVKITFADGSGSVVDTSPPITKEENASFFRGVKCQVGLEVPVVRLNEPRTINLFLDHFVDLSGQVRSVPFSFAVSRIEVSATRGS